MLRIQESKIGHAQAIVIKLLNSNIFLPSHFILILFIDHIFPDFAGNKARSVYSFLIICIGFLLDIAAITIVEIEFVLKTGIQN